MKKLSLALCGVAGLALSTVGFAGGPDVTAMPAASNANSGFYVSGNIGYGVSDAKKIAGLHNERHGFIFNGEVGYQFNQYFAIGTGYTRYADIKSHGYVPALPTPYSVSNKDSLQAFYMVVKGIYPINQQFNVFVKAGLADMFMNAKTTFSPAVDGVSKMTASISQITPMFGLGGDYNINQNLAVTAQLLTTLKSGVVPATYAGTVGLTYRIAAI